MLRGLACLFVCCLLLMAQSVMAGKIYQWKDEQGHMHFTDDKSKVPQQGVQKVTREMKSFKPEVTKATMKGAVLYESLCAKCHVLGFKDDGRKEALGWSIIDGATKYPKERTELFDRLRYVVDGGIDMPVIDINDEDLMSLTDYFIEKLKP